MEFDIFNIENGYRISTDVIGNKKVAEAIRDELIKSIKIVEKIEKRKKQLDHGEEYTYEPYRTVWLEFKSILGDKK